MRVFVALVGIFVFATAGLAADSDPGGAYRALIIAGVAGDQKNHVEFWETAQRFVSVLTGPYGYARENVTLLFDDEARVGVGADGLPRRETIEATVERLRAVTRPEDQLLVVVLGHAEMVGRQASVHLPGRDIRDKDLGELFAGFPGRLILIVSTPVSGYFMAPLQGPGRIVITATKADREINKVRFGRVFSEVLEKTANAGERPSIGELYMQARALVDGEFKTGGLIPTEHAMLDDNGDGEGTREIPGERDSGEATDGALALATYVGPAVRAAALPAAEAEAEVTEAGSKWAELKPPAIVLLKEIDYSISTDLTYRIRERRRVKVLNKGGHEYSEVIVFYNTFSETLEIEEAKTIKPSGEVAVLDAANIHDVKSTTALFYTESRYKRFSMPSVEDGCILDYTFVKTGKSVQLSREFWNTFAIEMPIPQERVVMRFTVPDTKRVNTRFVPSEPPFSVEKSERTERYGQTVEYVLTDIAPLRSEPYGPAPAALSTRLISTSIASWDMVWDWYRRLSDNARQADEPIRQAVAQAIEGQTTELEKARAVYNYVCSKIRYVGLELGPHGYQPHSASSIYENRYGDCKDKATLLLTMLDEAGIRGSIVLVATDVMAQVDPEMPTLDQFNHAIATVVIDGTRYWLDSTGGETAFGDIPVNDQGRTVFVIGEAKGEFMQIPVLPAEANLLRNTGTAAVGRDGTLRVEEHVEYRGAFADQFRATYRYADAAGQKAMLQEALGNFSAGATLDQYAIQGMVEMADAIVYSRTYTAPSYASTAGDLIVLTAPLQRIGLLNLATIPERQQPLRLGQTMRREGELVLAVPQGFRVRNLPEALEIRTEIGTYSESYSVNKDGAIVCCNRFELGVAEISPADYAEFRAFVRDVAQAQRRIIVLIEEASLAEHADGAALAPL
ncbi:MAG: DUF3857 domain-containing protein [Verrucomicrobia bacterium]|nr:DUF3857 domain-containing protein [Verrucomicrobiota bacterium]